MSVVDFVRRKALAASPLLIIVPLVAAACVGGGGGDGEEDSPPDASTATPAVAAQPTSATAASDIDFSSPSTLAGADPEFSYSAMIWQGYWLSRDQFGPLAMGSGMGITFMPPEELVQGAMRMVGGTATDRPVMPDNLAPLQAVYRSGDTALLNDITAYPVSDFTGLRLDPDTFEAVVGVEGQAQLMLKESQWARNFHTESHFGTPESDFGAQQRFLGMMVSMLAQMQGRYAIQELMDPATGLYRDGDGQLDFRGNWTLLQAFADIAGITGDESLRYFNPDAHAMFAGAAARLAEALGSREPQGVAEWTSAIRALAFVAWTADDQDLRAASLDRIRALGSAPPAATGVVEQSAAIAGFIAAGQALDDGGLVDSARPLWKELKADFDPEDGVFRSQSIYTTDDVAWIIGGLNSLTLAGPEDLRGQASAVLLAFFEALLDRSGMQLAAPPGKSGAMAGEFEKDLPSVVYYHGRNTPPPPMAGGESGRAALPAAAVEFKDGAWEVLDTRFESAGGMHLANELNWLGPHLGSVMFPPLRGGEDEPAGAAGGGTEITLTAANIQYDQSELVVPAGAEVTITFVNNDDSMPHNLHLTGPGGFDVKTEIFTGSQGRSRVLTFVAPSPGTYTFSCDVHPAQMTGTLTVR